MSKLKSLKEKLEEMVEMTTPKEILSYKKTQTTEEILKEAQETNPAFIFTENTRKPLTITVSTMNVEINKLAKITVLAMCIIYNEENNTITQEGTIFFPEDKNDKPTKLRTITIPYSEKGLKEMRKNLDHFNKTNLDGDPERGIKAQEIIPTEKLEFETTTPMLDIIKKITSLDMFRAETRHSIK